MPKGSPGRLGVAIASDDSAVKATVMALVDELGFEPIDAGTIADTWRQQPGTPWYGKGLDADGVRKALAEASPERPKERRTS
jgi:predicted dinucleotide-binding enzyme